MSVTLSTLLDAVVNGAVQSHLLYPIIIIIIINVFVLQDMVSLVAALTLSIFWVGYVVGFKSNSLGRHATLSNRDFEEGGNHIWRHAVITNHHLARRPITPFTPFTHPGTTRAGSATVIQPDEPCRPAETRRRRDTGADGRWFNFSKYQSFIQFFVFSAFWDDRPSNKGGRPLVRVIAASTSSSAGVMLKDPVPLEYNVSCRFHLPDGRWLKPVSVLPLALPIGYGWWLNGKLIREFIYDCPLSVDEGRPDGVTMLIGGWINSTEEEMEDLKRTACVPIEFPEKPSVKRDLAACVQVTELAFMTLAFRNS